MNDDWRLRTNVLDHARAAQLTKALEEGTHTDPALGTLHDRVIVTHDAEQVFCYAGTREQAQDAQRAIEAIASERGWRVEFELRHWHPTAEAWEDPDLPLPADDAQAARERGERIAQERAESAAEGYPEFEVRVKCASHGDARDLAAQLDQQGMPHLQRWTAVIVGATDEESAGKLAGQLRQIAPAGSEVTVEGNARAAYEAGRGLRPYWVLGGLGG
jgi:hypothetical protein